MISFFSLHITRSILPVVIIFIFSFVSLFADDPGDKSKMDSIIALNNISLEQHSMERNGIYWERVAFSGGAAAVMNVALWNYYNKAWYTGERAKMHSVNDWYSEKLNIDKLEHIHGAIALQKISYYLMRWSNVPERKALWIGSAAAWLLQLQIELSDSRFQAWGFSWWDLAANTAGALYPTLQHYYPPLKPFNFKFSYSPSQSYNDKLYKQYIDDYEGKTLWVSVDVNDFLSGKAEEYYPDWLNIAVGYGGTNLLTSSGSHNIDANGKGAGDQEWIIGLDYNLLKLFNPDKDTFWYGFLDMLNLIKFPAPALKITPNAVFYGLYF